MTVNHAATTLALSGNNTYTGNTTVTTGTLLINGSTSSSSAVTVASTATLGGSGTIGGNVTIQNGGFLAPGNNTTGTLTLASLTLNTTSTTEFEINGTTGGSYDRIKVNTGGGLALNGVFTINFTSLLPLDTNTTIILFDFTPGHSSGDFTKVSSTGSYALDTWVASGSAGAETFTYNNGHQMMTFNEADGTLNIVPEPATWALLAFSLTTVMVLRRRRNS